MTDPEQNQPVIVIEPCIAITLKEWQRMNQRIGYLEGVWIGIKELCHPVTQDTIDKRYAEICGEVKQ